MAMAGATAPTRRSRRRLLLVLLVVSAALNVCFIGGAAWIRLRGPPPWPGMEERYRRMPGELGLDAQQKLAFDAYVAAMRASTGRMHEQVAPLINGAWEEIAKPQSDSAQVMRLFDEAAQKRSEFQRETTAQTFQFLGTLSPEQRGKFVAIIREQRPPWLRGRPAQR